MTTESDLTYHEVQLISGALKKYRDTDYGQHIFFPLKRSYEKAMAAQGISHVEQVMDKIKHDKNFSEEFLKDIAFHALLTTSHFFRSSTG